MIMGFGEYIDGVFMEFEHFNLHLRIRVIAMSLPKLFPFPSEAQPPPGPPIIA